MIMQSGSGKLPYIRVHSQCFFLQKKLLPTEKLNFWILLSFLNILEKNSAISEILGSIQWTGCGMLICLWDYAQFLLAPKAMALG